MLPQLAPPLYVALLVLSKTIKPARAQAAIDAPSVLQTCVPATIAWSETSGPYHLTVLPGTSTTSNPIKDLGTVLADSLVWKVDLDSGTLVTFALTDGSGATTYSDAITISPSLDSSCVNVMMFERTAEAQVPVVTHPLSSHAAPSVVTAQDELDSSAADDTPSTASPTITGSPAASSSTHSSSTLVSVSAKLGTAATGGEDDSMVTSASTSPDLATTPDDDTDPSSTLDSTDDSSAASSPLPSSTVSSGISSGSSPLDNAPSDDEWPIDAASTSSSDLESNVNDTASASSMVAPTSTGSPAAPTGVSGGIAAAAVDDGDGDSDGDDGESSGADAQGGDGNDDDASSAAPPATPTTKPGGVTPLGKVDPNAMTTKTGPIDYDATTLAIPTFNSAGPTRAKAVAQAAVTTIAPISSPFPTSSLSPLPSSSGSSPSLSNSHTPPTKKPITIIAEDATSESDPIFESPSMTAAASVSNDNESTDDDTTSSSSSSTIGTSSTTPSSYSPSSASSIDNVTDPSESGSQDPYASPPFYNGGGNNDGSGSDIPFSPSSDQTMIGSPPPPSSTLSSLPSSTPSPFPSPFLPPFVNNHPSLTRFVSSISAGGLRPSSTMTPGGGQAAAIRAQFTSAAQGRRACVGEAVWIGALMMGGATIGLVWGI